MASIRAIDKSAVGTRSVHNNLENKDGTRSNVRASLSRRTTLIGGEEVTLNVFFVPDTHHNRSVFLTNPKVIEVAELKNKKWTVIPDGWMDEQFVFAADHAVENGDSDDGKQVADSDSDEEAGVDDDFDPAKVAEEPEVDFTGATLEELLTLKKAVQEQVVNHPNCPLELLQAVANCSDTRLGTRAQNAAAKRTAEDPVIDESTDSEAPEA